jgi:hypothetical protein
MYHKSLSLLQEKNKILLNGNKNILPWAFLLLFDTGKGKMKAAYSSYKRFVRSYQDCTVENHVSYIMD